MSTILIRQIPDDYAEATGLAKYNRSRMPGTADRLGAALNSDGRRLTGIDEDSYTVSKDKYEEIKNLRLNLEKKTGQDLSATSTFWDDFQVAIYSDKPKVFNTENPMDLIGFTMLIANKEVAPSKEAASTPQYRDAQYYAYTEEGESQEEATNLKKRDRALAALLEISEDKNKMLLYGQYLEGLKYSEQLKPDALYKMLRTYIENKEIQNSINFTNALKQPIEKLQVKSIVDKALKNRLISRSSIGNKKQVYQYGQVTLGITLEELYSNMLLPDFAPELLSIKKDLESK